MVGFMLVLDQCRPENSGIGFGVSNVVSFPSFPASHQQESQNAR